MRVLSSFFLLLTLPFQVVAESWPDWVLLTTSDNEYFRSVGVADSKKEAITLALDDINGLLQSRINSSTTLVTQKKGRNVSSEFRQLTKLDSRSRKFSNITIENKFHKNDKVAVQISISKNNIINSLISELSLFFKMNKSDKQLFRLDDWQQKIWSMQQKSQLYNIAADMQLLETLSQETSELTSLQQDFGRWQHLMTDLADKAHFEVQSPDSLFGIVELLSSQLAGGQGKTYWLQPELVVKKARKGKTYYAQLQLSIKVIESSPPFRTVYSNSIKHQQKADNFIKAKELALNELIKLMRNSDSFILFNQN
ncbi:MAG: hypothetical protein ACI8SC_000838 [Colwellia sp.]|jgi:hypothetical protein